MAIPVRGGAEKWQQRAQAAQLDYAQGVQNPRVRWDQATVAAAASYEQGVQQAIANKSFQKGVQAAGHDYWQQQTLAVGPGRFAEGVRNGAENYTQGFAPYVQVLQNTTLPPRGPRGSEGNYQRSVAVGKALAAKRVALKKGT